MENETKTNNMFPWGFFILTIFFTWLIYLPGVLQSLQIIDWGLTASHYSIMNLLGGFGPSIMGLIYIYKEQGKPAFLQVLKSTFSWKNTSGIWWILLIFGFPLISGLVFLGFYLTSGVETPPVLFNSWGLIPLYFLAQYLPIGNGFREEFGWRGYAIDRMQKIYSPVITSIIIGFFWGIWHLPLRLFPAAAAIYDYIPIWVFIGNCIIFSCYMTWFHNNMNHSMLVAITAHGILNLTGEIFQLYLLPNAQIIQLGILIGIFILIRWKFGPTLVIQHEISSEVCKKL